MHLQVQVKLHSGYNSCERCTAVGTYRDRRVVFPFYACKMRHDNDFRNTRHPQHHVGRSPIEVLDIDMMNLLVCIWFVYEFVNVF